MSTTSSEPLVEWMLGARGDRDRLMDEERSRAVHEEFILAEGGVLPDPESRLVRARGASARAWLRLAARAVVATRDDVPGSAADRFDAWLAASGERLESLEIEEHGRLSRRGLTGDPAADRRGVQLMALVRLFGEGLGEMEIPGIDGPSASGRALTAWLRENEARVDELVSEAGAAPPPEGVPADRAAEMAVLWAHMRLMAGGAWAVLPAPPSA